MGKPIAEAEWDIVRHSRPPGTCISFLMVRGIGWIAHTCSTGCNVSLACAQDDVAGCYEYYADLAEKLDARQNEPIEVPMEEFKTCLRREPLGVVGLISAWN